MSSYSRTKISNDNAFSEPHFKTMKYRTSYPKVVSAKKEQEIGIHQKLYH